MLAENLENLVKKERLVGRQGGERLHAEKTALNMMARTKMDDAMIAEIVRLTSDDVARLRTEQRHWGLELIWIMKDEVGASVQLG